MKKQEGTYYESKFSYGLTYDVRDQKFQTTEGFRTQFNQSIPLISNDWAFGNTIDYKIWQKLPNNMVTSFNAYEPFNHYLMKMLELLIDFIYHEKNLKVLKQGRLVQKMEKIM